MHKLFCFLVVLMLALAISGYTFTQEREPNNQRAQADSITGLVIRGYIDNPSDVDWFVLNGQEGTNPTFIIHHDSDVDFDFEVYSDMNRMGSATGSNSGDSMTCNIPGRCYIRIWSCRGTGNYEIVIRPVGQQPDGGGADEREPNDMQGQADRISPNQFQIRGTIAHPGDVDWFVLSGNEGSSAVFSIQHSPSDDFDFEIYSNNQVVGRAIGSQSGDSVSCRVPGTCYIKVWSSHGVGRYRMTFTPTAPPQPDNNTYEYATPVSGLEINESIHPHGDVDWFVLSARKVSMLLLRLSIILVMILTFRFTAIPI